MTPEQARAFTAYLAILDEFMEQRMRLVEACVSYALRESGRA